MPVTIGRRELIAALSGAAAWPLDINLRAAKTIGHEVPAGLVLRADEVIE
jgi:hypothetical protein